MSEINNNNQIVFYRNQIGQNQDNQPNMMLRQERKEVSFHVDPNFLNSSVYRFLEQNFQKIQNVENINQSIAQFHDICQFLGQEIINIRNDFSKALITQENKINLVNESKNKVNEHCIKFYEDWKIEDSRNKEDINNVNKAMNENNNKIEKEINNQSKRLDESFLKSKLDNDNIKNDFKNLKNKVDLAQNKNDRNESLIKSLTETCNNNNKKIIELETKLTNLENLYKNNNEISKIKSNLNDFEIQIKKNSNNTSDLEKNFSKFKEINEKNFKDLQENINKTNEKFYTKFEEIAKEINKLNNDLLMKKSDCIKMKSDKSNEVLENVKQQFNDFIENNNKEVNEMKNKQKKDFENLNNHIKKEVDRLNNECDNKLENNLKNIKNSFEKIENDFKIQNDININYQKSLDDINNKIDTKIIMQNLNNKNKINIENKKIAKYEMINDKPKIYKMSQWNNQISFKDITNECEEDKINETIEKIKILFKKDEEEKDKIVYEVSKLHKDWDFKRHIINLFKRINNAKEIKRINFNKLKYVYILKFTDNQIHFIKKEAILNFVKNNNFYVKIDNNFVFVNNKRRKFYNNRKYNN